MPKFLCIPWTRRRKAERAAIAARRQQNLHSSLQSRLPVELWWESLPFSSRLAVSQTCSYWRSVALDFPPMWTNLEVYTTVHESDCSCTSCSNSGSHPPGWAMSPYQSRSHNLYSVMPLLARCRDAPLHISVDIVPYMPKFAALIGAAKALSRHPHPIHGISFRFCDYLIVYYFMVVLRDQCDEHLRTIKFEVVPDLNGDSVHGPVLLKRDQMRTFTRLESVHLSGTAGWASLPWNFPAVRSFVFQPSKALDGEILDVLSTCRKVSVLTLDMDLLRDINCPDVCSEDLLELAVSLCAVRVQGLKAQYEGFLLSEFHLGVRTELSLGYNTVADIGEGPAITRDLSTEVRLRISRINDTLSLEGTDGMRRIRGISVRTSDDDTLRADLLQLIALQDLSLWPKAVRLSTGCSLWCLIAHVLPETRSLLELNLTVDTVTAAPLHEAAYRRVPTLTLLSRGGLITIQLSEITALVIGLRVALPLTQLRIDHRLIEGRAASFSLAGLAQEVHVGVFHV